MGVTVTDDQLSDLLQCLRKHAGSEKICGEISSKLDHVMCDYEFIVDSWPDVKAVVSRANPKQAKFKFARHYVNVFATDVDALRTLLQTPGTINWSRRASFSSVSQDYFFLIKDVIREHNIPSYIAGVCVMLKTSREKIKLSPIPEGFELRSLQPEQSDLVNSQWQFSRDDVSNIYIKHMIETRPSCCLYSEGGDLVGYALTFHYGRLGLLHVREKYKGNGYEKVILSHLANKCLQAGIDPFVFMEEYRRDDSQRSMYADIGFEGAYDKPFLWIRSNQ